MNESSLITQHSSLLLYYILFHVNLFKELCFVVRLGGTFAGCLAVFCFEEPSMSSASAVGFLLLRHLRKRGETDCKGTTNFSISPNFSEKNFKKFFNNLLKTFVFDLRNSPKAALFSSKAGAKVRTFFKPPNFSTTFFQKK